MKQGCMSLSIMRPSLSLVVLNPVSSPNVVASVDDLNISQGLTLNVIPAKPPQKKVRYTFENFFDRAYAVHGDKYDYSGVTREHIKGRDSRVPVKCKTCHNKWNPTIGNHVTKKAECAVCMGNARWTLEKFLATVKKVHGDKYDYSLVTKDHIMNNESHIPVICKTCLHQWSPDIHAHTRGTKCPGCVKRIPWTLERFLVRAREIHGELYNYSHITEADIAGANCYVSIECNRCHKIWESTIDSHVKNHGCPNCNMSKGEKICMEVLERMNISYKPQKKIKAIHRRPFDFGFKYNTKRWLLEFDGGQHFEFNKFFHRTEEKFHYEQSKDIMKTKTAINNGYHVIRIDYTQADNIELHIRCALQLMQPLYLSTPDLYNYIN